MCAVFTHNLVRFSDYSIQAIIHYFTMPLCSVRNPFRFNRTSPHQTHTHTYIHQVNISSVSIRILVYMFPLFSCNTAINEIRLLGQLEMFNREVLRKFELTIRKRPLKFLGHIMTKAWRM